MARKKFERTTRRFQLRRGSDYPQDEHVLEVLEYAKKQKREVELIRNAVELFYALEQGNLDVLYEAFPQYKAAVGGNGGAGGLDEDKLVERIAERVAMMTVNSQYKMSSTEPAEPTPTPTGKLLSNKVLSAPLDDDEPLPMLVTAKSKVDCSANFLKGLQSLQ